MNKETITSLKKEKDCYQAAFLSTLGTMIIVIIAIAGMEPTTAIKWSAEIFTTYMILSTILIITLNKEERIKDRIEMLKEQEKSRAWDL